MDIKTDGNIGSEFDLSKLGIAFKCKPIVVGGLAMQYYGLRKRGSDVDFIVCNDDYQVLAKKYPENKKDKWADLGVNVYGFEMFRSIWKFDYNFFSVGAAEYDKFKVISFDKLFLMKVLAMDAEEKHKKDVGLILDHYKRSFQNPEYKQNMDENAERYLAAPGGVIYGDQ